MSDSVVLEFVLCQLEKLDVGRTIIIGDRGFYSEANIACLVEKGHRFTIPVPSNVKWTSGLIARHRSSIQRPDTLIATEDKDSIVYGLKTVHTTRHGQDVGPHLLRRSPEGARGCPPDGYVEEMPG